MLKLYEVTTCVYFSFPMIGLDVKKKLEKLNIHGKIHSTICMVITP